MVKTKVRVLLAKCIQSKTFTLLFRKAFVSLAVVFLFLQEDICFEKELRLVSTLIFFFSKKR